MLSIFHIRRCLLFILCVSITIMTIFFYNYSNEFTSNLAQPYMQKQLQNLDLEQMQKLGSIADVNGNITGENPNQNSTENRNLDPQIGKLIKNTKLITFFKDVVKENEDFFIKLKDMQQRNVSFSEAGRDQLVESDLIQKSSDQLPQAPNLLDLLSETENSAPTESNSPSQNESLQTNSTSLVPHSEPITEKSHTTTNKSRQPFFGNVSEIYVPGFSYSPSEMCENQGKNLQLLIIVTSAPGNFEARNAIRQTWGRLDNLEPVKLAFIVGSSIPKNEQKLKEESFKHNDIIHGNFVDSYYNLTLKTISILEWVSTNCPKAKFILKADDDTFINVKKLLQLIEPRMNDTKSIYGRVGWGWHPIRDEKSKYFISNDEYEASVFPDFTSGPAYMMTKDCVKIIYEKALKEKYLKLEDVFITGIIASLLEIQKIQLNEFINDKPNNFDKCMLAYSVSVHYISAREQLQLWKTLNDKNQKC